jgi:16S rRNA (uracil1498-N3)-methyltransferase
MSHLHRFHVPADTPEAGLLPLPEAEAHHALRVVRLRDGEEVELFDGAGRVWRGTFEQTGKRDALVKLLHCEQEAPPPHQLTLVQANLHRDQAVEELLRRGTEVGVTRFQFFRAARSEHAPKLNAKWERLLVETCKQCGRNWLPAIEVIADPVEAVRAHLGTCYVAAMRAGARPVAECAASTAALLVVGPEGDITPQELDALCEAGAAPITLGPYVYRAEVAAILGATLLLHHAGAFGAPAPKAT